MGSSTRNTQMSTSTITLYADISVLVARCVVLPGSHGPSGWIATGVAVGVGVIVISGRTGSRLMVIVENADRFDR